MPYCLRRPVDDVDYLRSSSGHQVVLVVSEQALEEEWLSQLRHYATHVLIVEGTDRDLTVRGTYRFKAGKLETAVRILITFFPHPLPH